MEEGSRIKSVPSYTKPYNMQKIYTGIRQIRKAVWSLKEMTLRCSSDIYIPHYYVCFFASGFARK